MEEIMLRKSGLEMVDSSELTMIKGGNLKELADLAYKAYRFARALNEYLPSFWRGFKKGWNS